MIRGSFAAMYVLTVATCWALEPPASAPYPWDLLEQPDFKAAYFKALGSKAQVPWIGELSGPADQATRKNIDGEEYWLANSCKPHACQTDNIVFAYGISSKRVFVKLVESTGRGVLLGSPPAGVKVELEAYYASRFPAK